MVEGQIASKDDPHGKTNIWTVISILIILLYLSPGSPPFWRQLISWIVDQAKVVKGWLRQTKSYHPGRKRVGYARLDDWVYTCYTMSQLFSLCLCEHSFLRFNMDKKGSYICHTPPDWVICFICHLHCRNSLITKCCGHVMCNFCLGQATPLEIYSTCRTENLLHSLTSK